MAFIAQPPLCLFLLVLISFSWSMGAAAATVPISEGLGWKDHKGRVGKYLKILKLEPEEKRIWGDKGLQVPADIKRSEVLALLSGLADWATYMNVAPLSRQEKTDLRSRQERATFPQPPVREKSPCKNFFWKTFSSC